AAVKESRTCQHRALGNLQTQSSGERWVGTRRPEEVEERGGAHELAVQRNGRRAPIESAQDARDEARCSGGEATGSCGKLRGRSHRTDVLHGYRERVGEAQAGGIGILQVRGEQNRVGGIFFSRAVQV